jgi:hypothetical protein
MPPIAECEECGKVRESWYKKCDDCRARGFAEASEIAAPLGQVDLLVSCKMTSEELVQVFADEGMMITLGAQYSVKGQIAQLLNGLKKLGISSN